MNKQTIKKLKRAAVLTVLFFVGFSAGRLLAQDNSSSLLWEVSGKNLETSSYLFGTYHLLNATYLDDKPAVINAIKKASGIVVEMVIDSTKLMQVAMMSVMQDRKISGMISEEDFNLVSNELEKTVGFKLQMLDQFKPMAITVMLVGAYAQQESGQILQQYTGLPLDIHFAQSAKHAGKQVTALETMEEQIKLLYDHTPYEEQAKDLVKFVKSKDEMLASQSELLGAYLSQDLKEMENLYIKYSDVGGMGEHILEDRNVRWMETLPDLISSSPQFIAVGALHLAGDKGLITLLRARGYTVKPVAVKP